jgi:hypothetical protein
MAKCVDPQSAVYHSGYFMHSFRLGILLLVMAIAPLGAQAPDNSGEPVRMGPGVAPPRLIRKVEPEYSPEARANHIQGSVVLLIVIDEKGKPARPHRPVRSASIAVLVAARNEAQLLPVRSPRWIRSITPRTCSLSS